MKKLNLNNPQKLIPGFIVCLLISLLSQKISSYVPGIGSALFAIGIGMLCGNTFLTQDVLNSGTKFSESRLLEYSIVLTGLTMRLSDMAAVGGTGIAFIALQMSGTILITYLIGMCLGFGKKFCLLMAAGNAVCGSSAIGAVSPILDVNSKDKGISITIVNVTGTVLMVLLPLLAGVLYQHDTIPTSGLIGGVLQSIGQVIASAKFVNEDVVQMATVFKIIRIVFLVAVALLFSKVNPLDGEKLFSGHKKAGNDSGQRKVSVGIPWFIIGFFLFSLILSTNMIPDAITQTAKLVSGQFEIIALAAIGMRVKFRDLVKEGPKALLYGGLVGAVQILLAMLLIFLIL